MALINVKNREVQIKIVYYGPGRGGKTTNLEYINRTYKEQIKTEMVSLKTNDDRTLFFDFLPFDVGKIKGFDVTIQLYTVPGQVKYNATRKLVLRGVDGIVFVADVQKSQRGKNIESLNQLYENLKTYQLDLFKMPLVMQYNKVDLRKSDVETLDSKTLQRDLNSRLKVPAFEASASNGGNVIPTLKKIISTTLVSIQDQIF
ncbi:MAG TPA: gliding motility protein [Desulfobacter sp.]|uniref:GTP-binding protein n=1 Tax=unclassified Desulfobacter TaxID=2634406 RepID=UPI000E980EC9|nr:MULTISPECIES: GTPase domain-containing protein [unclassified Desulfobacter]MBP8828356.1 GTPase domain-containing protein [Desulfobacter sp.]MBP9598006.1 GTPase domain-containing protein [Desulfobacter sp.]HAR34748.1 gliding motility protein [Desulfobacter sp.]HBT89302.1 gliding motility protein [Desulfobacter sp.]